MKSLLVLVATLAVSSAHLCLLSPHQRGSAENLNTPGADDCILLKGPCGERKEGAQRTVYQAGMPASIIFQKNLDHFNADMPGMFEINITRSEDIKFETLMMIPDTNSTSGTLYNVNVKMPEMEMERAILQVSYVTSNPKAPAVFYQCADISIRKM